MFKHKLPLFNKPLNDHMTLHHPAYVFEEKIPFAMISCSGGIFFNCPVSQEAYSFTVDIMPLNKSNVWGNCVHTQVSAQPGYVCAMLECCMHHGVLYSHILQCQDMRCILYSSFCWVRNPIHKLNTLIDVNLSTLVLQWLLQLSPVL